MNKIYLDIHGIVKIKLMDPPNHIYNFYTNEFKFFEKFFLQNEDIIINFKDKIRNKGFLIKNNQGKKIYINFLQQDPCKVEITADKCIDIIHLHSYVIEPIIQILTANKGKIFLHASSVHYGSKTFIFSGGRGSGKTIFSLKFLEKGAKFLGDDLVIIDKNKVYCYPKRLNLFYYHFKLCSRIKNRLNYKQNFFVFLSSIFSPFSQYIVGVSSFPLRIIRWISNYKFDIEKTFQDREIIIKEAKYSKLYIIKHNSKKNNIINLSLKEAVDEVIKNINTERIKFLFFYNKFIKDYNGRKIEIIEHFLEKERKYLFKYLKNKKLIGIEFYNIKNIDNKLL